MKNIYSLIFISLLSAFGISVYAQCPSLTCPSPITQSNDLDTCGAIVNYSAPVGIDACGSGSTTFTYTGAEQTWVVPAGVTSITVEAYGAQGGSNSASNVNYGGYVEADIAVVPGSTIYIYVGEQPTGLAGGFNGGGAGDTGGAGGGGASDIRIGGNTLNDRVVVAGGAGGGGFWNSQEVVGGVGGGLIAGAGYRDVPTTVGGDPGTQTSSGNGTCVSFDNPVVAGGFGFGGTPSGNGCGCEGYGGGGGWYGGGGSGNCRGGGGGSSYTIPSATNVTHTQGVNIGNGQVIISYAGETLPVNQIAGLASGELFPVGVTTNTFYSVSAFGNDTCSFTVTVTDTLRPSISCPGNVVSCSGLVNGLTPTTDDNCGVDSVYYTLTGATIGSGAGDASGTVFGVGVTTVQYTVTDLSDNRDSCSFTIEVLAPLEDSVTTPICYDDTVVVNGTSYYSTNPTGTEVYTGIGPNNCDSTVYVNLNVLPLISDTLDMELCDGDSIVVNGTVYNATNLTGIEVFPNLIPSACDSVVYVDLSIATPIDVGVDNSASPTLVANQSGASYQWLDCNNGNSPIVGATGQSFTATSVGSYAVAVTLGSCTDTSLCEDVSSVGIKELSGIRGLKVYPNPTNDLVNIVLEENTFGVNVYLSTVAGKVVYHKKGFEGTSLNIDLSTHSNGIYFLKVESDKQQEVIKVVKK